MSNRFVVTGACGFLGSHLCERLLNEGHSVSGVDGLTDSYDVRIKLGNRDVLSNYPNFVFHEGHLADMDLRPILDRADYVIHLAARAGVRGGWGPVFDDYQRDNVTSTQRLLEALRMNLGTRKVVIASTSSVYGRQPILPTPESVPLNPESYYAISKVACENLAESYFHHFGVPIVVLRFYSLYGPRQRPDMAFHIFLKALLGDRAITVFGDGKQTREVTYVTDAVEACLLALGTDAVGEVFNIGGGARHTLNEYLEVIESVVGRLFQRSYAPMVKGDQLHSFGDMSKANRILGYSPQFPLRDGMQAQFHWVRSNTG